MSESSTPAIGSVTWRDLTVEHASEVRDFYAAVVGWTSADHDMGGYADYVIKDASGAAVAGICHARGSNASLPPQWLIYITVENVEASAKACVEKGGEVLDGPRKMCGGQFCVIRDPAGAVAALIQS